MKYANIKYNDVANGEGVRTSLFVSGCRNHCKGCFNKETWDFNYGNDFTKEVKERILDSLAPEYISGLTVLGGDPFEPENQLEVFNLIKAVKERFPKKTIWVYTGYTLEYLMSSEKIRTEVTDNLLSYIDILVDGPFIEEQKKVGLVFRGSENQRVLDLKGTLLEGSPVLKQKIY